MTDYVNHSCTCVLVNIQPLYIQPQVQDFLQRFYSLLNLLYLRLYIAYPHRYCILYTCACRYQASWVWRRRLRHITTRMLTHIGCLWLVHQSLTSSDSAAFHLLWLASSTCRSASSKLRRGVRCPPTRSVQTIDLLKYFKRSMVQTDFDNLYFTLENV